MGIEINPLAVETARNNGIEIFQNVDDIPDESIDVVILDNTLEYTLQPLEELKSIYRKLKNAGK